MVMTKDVRIKDGFKMYWRIMMILQQLNNISLVDSFLIPHAFRNPIRLPKNHFSNVNTWTKKVSYHKEQPILRFRKSSCSSSLLRSSLPFDEEKFKEDEGDVSKVVQSSLEIQQFSEQIKLLKDSIDIVEVIESYDLPGFKRKGYNGALAICPFHDDHEPSMSIDNNRKLFKCFSCGAGGDVFKFVQSYNALQGQSMTFYDAVRYVAQNFGDPTKIIIPQINSRMDPKVLEENIKRSRLLHCHLVAADFYWNILLDSPKAGSARAFLMSRKISASTTRDFAIGYAPDAYFSSEVWGKGSLVHHLRHHNFSASEILESGLAVVANTTRFKNTKTAQLSQNSEIEMDEFENLIDRFRARVVIPIFDETGKAVLAFGGRILTSTESSAKKADFKAPKYLNSPETLIFSKKNEVFGLNKAKIVLEEMEKANNGTSKSFRRSIVVVEGYMDVIAMCDVGIREVVASMGTALTYEQLDKVAKALRASGSRIILCLDNDNAGIMAIERLCSSGILSRICGKYVMEIAVATLPNGVKDPGEYFELQVGDSKAFRRTVLENATEWSRWYTNRIISQYDSSALSGAPNSFSDICDQVSEFLSTFLNAVERTRRTCEVSVDLARAISDNLCEPSPALRIQLESDLLSMVTRKASVAENIERRVESVDGYDSRNVTKVVKRMLHGGISDSSLENRMGTQNAFRGNISEAVRVNEKKLKYKDSRKNFESSTSSPQRQERYRTRMQRSGFRQKPLIQHFSGIDINKDSDASWLGVPKDKSKRRFHDLTFRPESSKKKYNENAVFFNSNEYHGDRYLSDDAANAGYQRGAIVKDSAFFEKGIGVLVKDNQEIKAKLAEERLLRNLVRYPSARQAMHAAVASSSATGAQGHIEWSSDDRKWLFHCLVDDLTVIPTTQGETNIRSLWKSLSCRSDVPVGAFGDSVVESDIVRESNHDTDLYTLSPVRSDDVVELEYASSNRLDGILEDNSQSELSSDISQTKVFSSTDKKTSRSGLNSDVWDFSNADFEVSFVENLEHLKIADTNTFSGTLDRFFLDDQDIFEGTYDNSVKRSYRAELEVQEALAYLLRASAATKLSNVNSNWLLASRLLESRLEESEESTQLDVSTGIKELDSMNIDDLQVYCQSLLVRLSQLHGTVHQLDVSASRICSRLLEFSQSDSTEGRISSNKQDKLHNELDEFLKSLPEGFAPPDTDCELMDPMHVLSLFPQDGATKPKFNGENTDLQQEQTVENLEQELELMAEEWGEMMDDDYVWLMPDDSLNFGQMYLPNHSFSELDVELEEPLDEAIARIDEEWGDWDCDESNLRPLTSPSLDSSPALEPLGEETVSLKF
jgi:DNA primase catalytic core